MPKFMLLEFLVEQEIPQNQCGPRTVEDRVDRGGKEQSAGHVMLCDRPCIRVFGFGFGSGFVCLLGRRCSTKLNNIDEVSIRSTCHSAD